MARASVLAAALAATSACHDAGGPESKTPPALPTRVVLRAVADSDGVAIAGQPGYAPAVRVTDTTGRVVAFMPVSFAVVDGEGQVEFTRDTTDAAGIASAGRWTPGSRWGVQEVRASAGDSASTRFRVTAVAATGPLAADAQCPVSDSLLPSAWVLPRTTARLVARESLTVVAIGSSSTVGAGGTQPDSSYPTLLRGHLARRFPASGIRVINAGIGGQSLMQLQARFGSDVLAHAPQLVILQAGTIDAIIGMEADTFAVRLRGAVDQLLAGGADVILLDSQWYPGGDTPRYRLMQQAQATVATARQVGLLRRFAWMEEMVLTRRYTADDLLWDDIFHPSDLTYSCTGRLLAEGIVRAVAATARR